MFKILLLIMLQFCVHRGDLEYAVKSPDGVELGTELLCPAHYCLTVPFVFNDFKQRLKEKVGNTEAIKDWKSKNQRNWLSCFLIEPGSVSISEALKLLKYLIPIMGEKLWDKDEYGCNFIHYLVTFTASLRENNAEKQVLSLLKQLLGKNMQNFDCKNNYGVTQLLLAEMLGMKLFSKFIRESNRSAVYNDHPNLMRQLKDRLSLVATNKEKAEQANWEPIDSFLLLLNEIINKEDPGESLEIVLYSTVFLDVNFKNIIHKILMRKRIISDDFIVWWGDIQYCLSQSAKEVMRRAAGDGGWPSVVKALLDQGLDVKGTRVLIDACVAGHLDIIRMLLDAGADPNTKCTMQGRNALFYAASQGHSGAIDMLIDKGANISLSSSPFLLLAPIIWSPKHMDIFRQLVNLGASVMVDRLVLTLIDAQEEDVALDMVERGAIVDGQCLCHSIPKGYFKLAEAILAKGVDPNCWHENYDRVRYDTTPLYEAILKQQVELVEKLLDAGADPNFYSDVLYVPLYMVDGLLRKLDDEEEISQLRKIKTLLLKAGATYNEPDKNGVLPLHKAAQSDRHGMVDIIESILEGSGADVDLKNAHAKTALYYSAANFNIDSLLFLLKRKANLEMAIRAGLDVTELSKKGGRALVHILADTGYFDLIFNMKLSKEKLNITSRNGKTILNYAVTNGVDHKRIDKLIKAGCRLDIREKGQKGSVGRMVIEIPLKAKKWDMFKYLYKKMQEDPEASQLLEDKDLKEEIEKRATKDVKAFVADMQKQAADKVKGKGKKRKADDDSDDDGPAKKKQVVTKGKKRKADDDDNEDDGKQKAKKAKVVQTGKKGKGKKK